MTRITIETKWRLSDCKKVIVEVEEDTIQVNDMLELIKNAMCAYYSEINVYDAFKWAVEEYKHLEEKDDEL